jgi:hypothetical protein
MAVKIWEWWDAQTRCETNQLERKDSIAAVTKVMKDDVAEVIVDEGCYWNRNNRES